MSRSQLNTLTYEDYARTPDDERWELLNGELVETPSRNTAHQRVTGNLFFHMLTFVKATGLGRVFVAPFDVILSPHNVVQPDILFIADNQRSILTAANVKGSPALVIEVSSPSTYARDRAVKRNIYAEHGVREYWLADPDTNTVSVMVLEAVSPGKWVSMARMMSLLPRRCRVSHSKSGMFSRIPDLPAAMGQLA